MSRVDDAEPKSILGFELSRGHDDVAPSRGRADLGFEESEEPGGNDEVDVEFAHVEESPVAAHEDVVVGEGEDVAGGGGMAGDGGDGGHGEREEIGDDGAEEGVHEDHALLRGLGPRDVVAIGEEFAVRGGDEGGGDGGFLTDAAEGGLDGLEESRVETVLALAGEG